MPLFLHSWGIVAKLTNLHNQLNLHRHLFMQHHNISNKQEEEKNHLGFSFKDSEKKNNSNRLCCHLQPPWKHLSSEEFVIPSLRYAVLEWDEHKSPSTQNKIKHNKQKQFLNKIKQKRKKKTSDFHSIFSHFKSVIRNFKCHPTLIRILAFKLEVFANV